jgi:hypothetical protein
LTPGEWQEFLNTVWRQAPGGIGTMVSLNLDAACYGCFPEAKGQRVRYFAFMDRRGALTFASRPQDAPVIHLGGPLPLLLRPYERLRRGDDRGEISLWLGTPGLGAGTFAVTWYDLVPGDVTPVVEVLFPGTAPGREPLAQRYALGRC